MPNKWKISIPFLHHEKINVFQMVVEISEGPTLSQQLVGLAHPVLDEALTVIQRLDALGLDGVHLSQQRGQPLRQQPSSCRLQL